MSGPSQPATQNPEAVAPVETFKAWVKRRPLFWFWLVVLLAIPYLLGCNAIALIVLTGGGCGG